MAQLYTEHTLKLPDGVEILYTDSGAPGTSDYTTLVVLHGTAFNGYGFVRLHEYASKYNMRVIVCNRRGYHGSTKFSEGEVAEMRAAPKVFQDRGALQLAWFLQHFVEERIPKATLDNANRNLGGGIVLMGWSFGNATSLALLADPGVIPKDVYGVIEPYLRTLVVYDPPDAVLAYSDPKIDGIYHPFADPEYTTFEEKFDAFLVWVSSYHQHPNLAARDPSGLTCARPTENPTPIVNRWTAEERARNCEPSEVAAVDFPAVEPPMQAVLKVQAHKVLFDEAVVASYFPRVNVVYITGEKTHFQCMWAFFTTERLYKEALGRGEVPRSIRFKLVPEGNHFIHYDMPESLMQEIVDGCNSK